MYTERKDGIASKGQEGLKGQRVVQYMECIIKKEGIGLRGLKERR